MTRLLPFIPFAAALLFAAAVMGGIAFRARYAASPGLAALLYPFSILFVAGCFEGLRLLSALVGEDGLLLSDLATGVRLLGGLGWFLYCHAQYRLHGILGWRRRLEAPVIAITAALVIAYIIAACLDARASVVPIGLAVMSLTALYAALSAILVLRKKVRLWPSSQAGIRMAVFALVAYPASLAAERLGFEYPFLDPARSVYEQLYPFFMAVFAALAVPALLSRAKGPLQEPGESPLAVPLTDREREVALLLREGRSLKEIASELSLSVSTIKSHANGAYKKLGVANRKELLLVRIY